MRHAQLAFLATVTEGPEYRGGRRRPVPPCPQERKKEIKRGLLRSVEEEDREREREREKEKERERERESGGGSADAWTPRIRGECETRELRSPQRKRPKTLNLDLKHACSKDRRERESLKRAEEEEEEIGGLIVQAPRIKLSVSVHGSPC